MPKAKKYCKCFKPLHQTLLNKDNVRFFTNFANWNFFKKYMTLLCLMSKRGFKGVSWVSTKVARKFARSPKNWPYRKIRNFWMTLMKLRLGLLVKHLAKRFKICAGLCSLVFHSWRRALTIYLGNLEIIPDEDIIRETVPSIFGRLHNTHLIFDCSEIFVETPKDHV